MPLKDISAEDLLEIMSILNNDSSPITRRKILIIGENMPEESDWLDQCIPFTGIGADQPTGVIGLPPRMYVERLIKSIVIFDDNTEDGLREIDVRELKTDDVVANIKMWEKRIPDGIQVVDENGRAMSREAWFNSISPVTGEPRRTDGLAIWAAKKLNWLQTGGGVQF